MELKANDFRLGNWIIDYEAEPEVTIYYQVEQIKEYYDGSGIGIVYRNGSCWASDVKPIPLTEEILLKCGFDDLGAYGWGIGVFHIRFRNLHKFYFPIDNKIVRIKSLHQLQNLYFALCQTELQIDLNN